MSNLLLWTRNTVTSTLCCLNSEETTQLRRMATWEKGPTTEPRTRDLRPNVEFQPHEPRNRSRSFVPHHPLCASLMLHSVTVNIDQYQSVKCMHIIYYCTAVIASTLGWRSFELLRKIFFYNNFENDSNGKQHSQWVWLICMCHYSRWLSLILACINHLCCSLVPVKYYSRWLSTVCNWRSAWLHYCRFSRLNRYNWI